MKILLGIALALIGVLGGVAFAQDQRLQHQQRCLSILETAVDPGTPATMREVIFTEWTRECL